MRKSVWKMAGWAGTILIGFVFLEMAVTEPGEWGQRLMMVGVGALFVAVGVLSLKITWREYKENKETDELTVLKHMMMPGFEESPDRNLLEETLTRFRAHYGAFFDRQNTVENEVIQQDVTQLYRNMLDFRKNRLARLNLTCETQSKRMIYQNKKGVTEKNFSDGKYEISEVTEEIAAKTIYKKQGEEVYIKLDKDIASYTLVSAMQVGEDSMICPNCGTQTTRDALLDGCDYCGTKFMVEDLGTKIAEFGLHTDYDVELAKYRKTRNKVLLWILTAIALVVLIWILGWMITLAPEMAAETDGFFMTVVSILGTVVLAGVFLIPVAWFLAGMVVLPVMLIIGTGNFVSNRILKKMRQSGRNDYNRAVQVRIKDPLFSISHFYTGVQNKLSSVIYADNPAQVQAFADCDLSGIKNRYSNVVGIDVDYMELLSYRMDKEYQHAEVLVNLRLTRYNGTTCKVKREEVLLKLKKSASCMTQVVCAPSFMSCDGCGASVDLLKGKTCPYCGHTVDMGKYDWVITDYRAR